MKRLLLLFSFVFIPALALAQSNFSTDAYQQFLQDNKDLSTSEALQNFAPKNIYYSEIRDGFSEPRVSSR